jgi:hypothetical protein
MAVFLHGVIQDTVNVVLIVAGVSWISIENLPDSVYACCVIEPRPEGLLDMLHSIDAQSIN